jgi:phosphoadenosine phosphosulfate reductase
MDAKQRPLEAEIEALEEAVDLETRFGHWKAEALVELAIRRFAGGIAAVSSFGVDSAVLLDMIARIDRSLPVLFLETGKHFGETLDYRDRLVDDLGLTNLRIVRPLDSALAEEDPDGILHRSDADGCCAIRKVEPMARAVRP